MYGSNPTHVRRRGRGGTRIAVVAALVAGAVVPVITARAAAPEQVLQGFVALAGAPASVERGRAFFTRPHGGDWSCASCHGTAPTGPGRHATTGKVIAALAPASNAERFTDEAKVEKWFRRNCKDVVARECTAAEKADVLAWLLSLGH